MDVTQCNFNEAIPQVLKSIDECDFIAIDAEFTGLRNGPDVTAYDTPETYYMKLRHGSLDFLLIQIGLCAFRFDRQQNKYLYKAFNFYVFPRSLGRNSNDVNFLCQSSSINFLCSYGFDFNKLFKEGIPYLNIADEEALNNDLVTKYENLSQSESSFNKVLIPDELVSTVEDACSRIEKFLSPNNQEKEIIFDNCNGFIRKLIFQTVHERFSTENFTLHTKWVDNHALLVGQKGKSKADIDRENYEREKRELSEAFGFSKMIKYISDSKKLVVGHNMLLDICHIVNRFCWPLPENYFEFKQMVHTLFPRIVDTKYMCSAYPFRDLIPSSVMDNMMKRLQEPPFEFGEVEAENPEFGYSKDQSRAHEAGYDAYMTGRAFITLTSYLGKKSNQTIVPLSNEALKPFENRLYIMRIIDHSFVNLRGDEPKPSRSHVFHISFPKDWKTSDIIQIFNPYGNIHVSYCNQTSAWVTLLNKEKSEAVIADLIEENLKELPIFRKPCTVMTYRQYVEENHVSPTSRFSLNSIALNVSAKTNSNSVTSTPVAQSSSSVSQSGGDAQPTSPEVKQPVKRASVTESVSSKRKKNEKNTNTETKNTAKLITDKSKDSTKIYTIDILSDQLRGSEDKACKTFEEPPWE